MSRKDDIGGETIRCSPAEALEQARYWYRVVRAHPSEVTSRGFCEAVALICREQGSEARYLIKQAKRIQREFDKQTWKSVKLTMRSGHHAGNALILGYEDGGPIVRGYVSRGATLTRCPWCGRAERHEGIGSDEDQVTVWCLTYWSAHYIVRLERLPILIPAYIPTRETGR